MDGMNPITRKEMFLAAAGGQDVETPTPVTREEAFLDAIVKGGGSSLPSTETASAGDVLSLNDNKEPQWAAPSGGGGGVLVVTDTDGTLDKTAGEIMAAAESGGACIKQTSGPISYIHPIVDYSVAPMGYGFCVLVGGEATYYSASGENDYPALSE